jgi:cytochrome P450
MKRARDQVVTLLLAGRETTAAALTWFYVLLNEHPDADARVFEEVSALPAGWTPDPSSLAKLTYTANAVKETLRLFPPAWVIEREAVGKDRLGDYVIPAGSMVWLSPFVTQRLPAFWTHPDVFDPDRFTQGQSRPAHPCAYFPLGGGPRQCIGQDFAMLELIAVVALVSREYRLQLLPNTVVERDAGVTLRPRGGVPMLPRLRDR